MNTETRANLNHRTLRERLCECVSAEGLLLLGVASVHNPISFARYERWLEEGRHGEMDFLDRQRVTREDANRILPGVRSAIVVALPYFQGDGFPSPETPPRIAQYARFQDYHRLFWRRGERIVDRMVALEPSWKKERFRVVADSAPVLERALAASTVKGFIGKNTCYIHPERGSFLLLGEILTTLPLDVDSPVRVETSKRTEDGGCGECTACQVACPTGALDEAYRIDARKCLAYWTIENRGPIPLEYWPWLKDYYFGCDLCQLACPFNQRAVGNELPVGIRRWEERSLFDVAVMNQLEYELWFGGTALTRARKEGLQRNALIAMVVTGDPRWDEAVQRLGSPQVSPIAETLAQVPAYLALRPPPIVKQLREYQAAFPQVTH